MSTMHLQLFDIDYQTPELRNAGYQVLRDIGYDLSSLQRTESSVLLTEAMRVEQMVRRYQALGVHPSLIRPFTHLALFDRKEDVRRFLVKLKEAGYIEPSVTRQRADDGRLHYFVHFGHFGALSLEDLSARVVSLGRNCYLCGGSYDGWQFATTVVESRLISAVMQAGPAETLH